MTDVVIAGTETLLGRLQRGRGQGYLGLNLGELDAFLLGPRLSSSEDDNRRDVLALHTLAWMGRLGREDAVVLLRRERVALRPMFGRAIGRTAQNEGSAEVAQLVEQWSEESRTT